MWLMRVPPLFPECPIPGLPPLPVNSHLVSPQSGGKGFPPIWSLSPLLHPKLDKICKMGGGRGVVVAVCKIFNLRATDPVLDLSS